ncbi:rhomboid family intramembrane serine protease [Natronosporangium hydrolyticum]|uniref:Rhomboid family intramembrane serine protease n=1 Tax=Natronosporangium hydrolyticum TaxID=2811111 RepID=A0A895YCQ0_9ACTN|nr:rhomboid family intramembrane serine protease [Natronosporangium hydrolyticum]QSB15281.1 rhomboid family intramembrane serine protease [Natronosporangium hydrolyticum]
MGELSRPDDGPLRFGTEAFYATIGRAFVVMCAVVPVLFLIAVLDWATPGYSFAAAHGIRPRDLTGLDGVLFAPLLHGSFLHVTANSVPLILLGTFVLAGGLRRTLWSTLVIMAVSGVGVWLLGNLFFVSDALRDANPVHVGASGVVFGFLGLLLTRGVVERSWWNAAVGVLIGVLYGWQLQGALPGQQGISWEGHLFGFLGGVAAAIIFRQRRRPAPPDPFGPGGGLPPDFRLPR